MKTNIYKYGNDKFMTLFLDSNRFFFFFCLSFAVFTVIYVLPDDTFFIFRKIPRVSEMKS